MAVCVDAFSPNSLVRDIDFETVKSLIIDWQDDSMNTKTLHLTSGIYTVEITDFFNIVLSASNMHIEHMYVLPVIAHTAHPPPINQ